AQVTLSALQSNARVLEGVAVLRAVPAPVVADTALELVGRLDKTVIRSVTNLGGGAEPLGRLGRVADMGACRDRRHRCNEPRGADEDCHPGSAAIEGFAKRHGSP